MGNQLFGSSAERSNVTYPQDRIVVPNPSNKFNGVVTGEWEEQRADSEYPCLVRVIDDAVRFESVDHKTRREMIDNFSRLEEDLKHVKSRELSKRNQGIAEASVFTVSGVVPFIVYGAVVPPLAIVATVSCVALAVFSGISSYKHHQAVNRVQLDVGETSRCLQEWKDPIGGLLEKRQRAGLSFATSYSKGWKGTIIHSDELANIWIRDFSKQRQRAESLIDLAGQQEFVEKSFSSDLLSKEAFAYIRDSIEKRGGAALRDGVFLETNALESVVEKFGSLQSAYRRLNTQVGHAIDQIMSSRDSVLATLESQRKSWLVPAQMTRKSALRAAQHHYEASISIYRQARDTAISQIRRDYSYTPSDFMDMSQQQHKKRVDAIRLQEITNIHRQYNSDPTVLQIERTWVDEQRWISFAYEQAVAPVNHWFEQQKKDVCRESKEKIAFVSQQHDREKHRFFQPLQQLIVRAETTTISQSPLGNFSWSNWHPRTNSPSFNQFYGSSFSYRSDFREKVPETMWNLFMGREGIHGYASYGPSRFDRYQPDFTRRWTSPPRRVSVRRSMNEYFRPQQPVPPAPRTLQRKHHVQPNSKPREVRVQAGTRRKVAVAPQVAATQTRYGYGGTKRRGAAQVASASEALVQKKRIPVGIEAPDKGASKQHHDSSEELWIGEEVDLPPPPSAPETAPTASFRGPRFGLAG